MKAFKCRTVAKRSGALERFASAKLRRSVENALRDSHADPQLARPLADAVAVHLQDCDDAQPPSTEYVHQCIVAVLSETGLEAAARCYRRHHERRAQARAQTRVYVAAGSSPAEAESWNKARLVAWLARTSGLRQPVARVMAAEIETKLLSLKYKNVSGGLVAALARNELAAWGLAEDPVFAAGNIKADGRAPHHVKENTD